MPLTCRVLLLALAALAPLAAATVRDLDLPPCVPLSRPVAIDGDLADWASIDGLDWKPLKGVAQSDLRAGREDVGARLRTAYDAQALYLAIDWASPSPPRNAADPADAAGWAEGGDGLELHLRVEGRVLHLVSIPLPDGRSASLLLRRGSAAETSDLRNAGGAAAMALRTAGWTHELRIPWSALRPEGVPAAGRAIDLALDLAWSALAGQKPAEVDPGLRRAALHVSHNALTARHRLHSFGYLRDPGDWGVLRLGTQVVPAALRYAPAGTGFCELVASPAAAPPAIDGLLPAAEWPATAIASAVKAPDLLGRRHACDLTARYDASNLYLAARISSPAAPFNSAHEKDQNGYGGGDCLQVRLERAGRRINLCVWPQADGSAALTADGRDLAQPFLLKAGAQLAIRHDPAAGAYVVELALPWTALFAGQEPPTAGEALRATAQAWWVGHGTRWCAMGSLRLQERGALELAWQNPQAGLATLGVYDSAGALLRWITRAEARPAGANRECWDGLDQWGEPIPAGSYVLKGLVHDPLVLEHRASIGNAGSPPWPTSDGRGDWLSDEAPPQAAATDGEWVFLAAPVSEKGWAVMAVDGEGRRQWGRDLPMDTPRCAALAVAGDRLYAAFSQPEKTDNKPFTGANAEEVALLVILDKRTGAPVGASAKGLLHKAAAFPYRPHLVRMSALRKDMAFTPAVYAGQPRYCAGDVGDTANVVGIAAMGGKVYLSCPLDDKVLVLDGETAARIDEIPLPDPVGLAATAQGLLAVSGRSVVRVDPASKRVTPVVVAGLDAPHSVCTDRAGEIYVSDWGKAFQVKVFGADGAPRRAIGKAGGRPWVGAFAKDGMLLPRGIAVTTAGRLWVAEDDSCPRRISVWDAKTGGLVRDFIGPISYGGATPFWVDPADDRVVYSQGTRFQVDWEKKTWTPQATVIRQRDPADPFTCNAAYSHCDGSRTVRRDGREYVMLAVNQQVVVMLRQGDRFVTVAALGGHHSDAKGTGLAFRDGGLRERVIADGLPAFFAGHNNHNYAWSDADGDGVPQAGEMTWAHSRHRNEPPEDGVQGAWDAFWGAGLGPDLSICFTAKNRSCGSIWRVTPDGFTASGAPRYDIAKAVCLQRRSHGPGKPEPQYSGVHVDDAGRIFVSYGFEWWPSGFNPVDRNCLECLAPDGRMLWSVAMPKDLRRTTYHASNVIDSFELPGIGGVIASWNWHGNFRPYLLTADGLYIDTLLEDSKLGPHANWDESYRRFFRSPDGTLNLVNCASSAHHVSAIRGLQDACRFERPLAISEDETRKAAELRSLPAAVPVAQPAIGVAWVANPPVIDGALEDWTEARPVVLRADDQRGAEVLLARDRDNLYLAFQVQDPSPLLNQGDDWQRLFVTGDCVDLMLAADPKADPLRKDAASGDQRLLISVHQGKPIAVLYQAVVAGAKAPVRFMTATMDEVRRLDAAKIAISRAGASYVVEAAVPLAVLGIDPGNTEGLRGDVGVVFSDQTGRNRELRLYHYNRDTAMTADLPTETRLQPANWGELRLPLGRNLLANGSFEEPLDVGWKVDTQQNGAVARIVDEGAQAGRQCLLLEQAAPCRIPEAALTEPVFGAFCDRIAAGYISIGHAPVPVTAGRRYALRVWLRSEGFGDRRQTGDPQRGYALVTPYLFWTVPGASSVTQSVITLRDQDLERWIAFRDDSSGHNVTRELVAPPGATGLEIAFRAKFAAIGRLPKVWIDEIEVVERP